MDEKLVKLKIIGVTFSQVQAGAYALILAEEDGSRRMPIIIGTPEAQSIAIFLEGLNPPRPLTHDLFISFMKEVKTELMGVYIYKYEDGVFFSKINFMNGENNYFEVDSRTSDAIALAIRCNAPIITTEDIMTNVGVFIEDSILDDLETEELKELSSYDNMSIEELEAALNDAVTTEDYEKAAQIKEILNKRS